MGHYNSVIPLTSDRLGNYDRVKVDPGQTSFFEGREFLIARSFSIPNGSTLVVKLVTLRNIIVESFQLSIDDGHLHFTRKTGGVEGGVFGVTLTPQPVNAMTGESNRRLYDGLPFASNTVITEGGTLTGGNAFDTISLKSAGSTAQASTVGTTDTDAIGVPPGTRYYVFENVGTGTVDGTFRVRWEERPD